MKNISILWKRRLFLMLLILTAIYSRAQGYNFTQMTNPDPNNNSLKAIWASDASHIFAGGGAGTILKFDGLAWNLMATPVTQMIQSLWGTSASNIWACGGGGLLLHYDGNAWAKITVPSVNIFYKIFGFSATNIYACGANGTFYHYNGISWTAIASGYSGIDFYSMYGSGSSDLYIVGNENTGAYTGKILHYDGSAFTPEKDITDASLLDIWSADYINYYVSGGNAIYSYDKNSNDFSTVFNEGDNTCIYGLNANLIMTGSINSHISLYNGIWQDINNTYSIIYGICAPGNSTANVYLVGGGGLILHVDMTSGINESAEANTHF